VTDLQIMGKVKKEGGIKFSIFNFFYLTQVRQVRRVGQVRLIKQVKLVRQEVQLS
jgi:hypothetical protein